MDLLVEKWEAAVSQNDVNIVRIHPQHNERRMVSAFYTYLLGFDTGNHDVPIIFESIYHDDEQYTNSLLNELQHLIEVWNNAYKGNLTIKTEQVNWHVNTDAITNIHPAALFVQNMNSLAAYLNLADKTYLVAILKVSSVQPEKVNRWLDAVLKAGMQEKFKILVDDTADHPFFEKLALKYPLNIITLHPQLDMDNAVQQMAAMGNPADPGVQYRQAFMKMMQAIEKRNESDCIKHAEDCIAIAEKHVPQNSFWIGPVLAVYCALANDQIGHRNFKKAIMYASKGVDTAEQSKEVADEFIYHKLCAQAKMTRGSLYTVEKKWEDAVADFTSSATHYLASSDMMLAMEAYRMTGYCYDKSGNNDAACKVLDQALRLSTRFPPHMLKLTTFPGVLELLIKINSYKYTSQQELEDAARTVYGDDWLHELANWKKPHYEAVTDPAQTVMA